MNNPVRHRAGIRPTKASRARASSNRPWRASALAATHRPLNALLRMAAVRPEDRQGAGEPQPQVVEDH